MILEACSYTIKGLFLHKGHGLCERSMKCQKRLGDSELKMFRQKSGIFEWARGNCIKGEGLKDWHVLAQGINRAGNLWYYNNGDSWG